MTAQRVIATSFNGGEVSRRMAGRVDTAVYQVALDTCENFVPTVEGPIVKRPGFEYIRAAMASASWLGEFRFNLTQDYALEWGEGALRFYTNGERIETETNDPYELAVPYTAAEAPRVSTQQSFDRLYLAHRNHPPAALTRTGAATFAYAPLALVNGPFADANSDESKTVTVSATTGAGVTVTASSPIFRAGHVGAPLRIEAKDFSTVRAWEADQGPWAIGEKCRSDGKVYQAVTIGDAAKARTGTIQPTHAEGQEWDGSGDGTRQDINDKHTGGILWQYLYDRFGVGTITAVGGGGTTATITVTRRLADSLTSAASFRWAHAAFSADAGWPNVVKVWAGRLVFFKDFDLVGSVAGDYLNFSAFTSSGLLEADLAFRRTLATEDPVLWAVGDRKLIVGTASRELAVGPTNAALSVSGDNVSAEPQSFYGSEAVFPQQLGTSAFFVQRGARKLRDAGYSFEQDRYVAANATVWARHITKSGIIQLAYQKEPEELLLAVRADGQLVAHPHMPEQDIKGFGRIRHSDGAGKVLSTVSIVGADGKSDEVWALIERAGAKSVERMAAWRDDGDAIEDSFFVDSGTKAAAAGGQTHFTGLGHLAGRPAAVLAAGGVVPGMVIGTDGSLDLPAAAVPATPYTLVVGLAYTATCVTLRPELKVNGQSSQGVRQRLAKIVLRLLETAGVKVGPIGGKLDNLIDRIGADAMDAPVPLFSGDSLRTVSGSWDDNGQMTVVSDTPLPCTVIAAMPRIELGDG